MTDLLNAALIQEIMEVFIFCVAAGIAVSCIITALAWAITTVLRLVHKTL